jgi:hypothetical protein
VCRHYNLASLPDIWQACQIWRAFLASQSRIKFCLQGCNNIYSPVSSQKQVRTSNRAALIHEKPKVVQRHLLKFKFKPIPAGVAIFIVQVAGIFLLIFEFEMSVSKNDEQKKNMINQSFISIQLLLRRHEEPHP